MLRVSANTRTTILPPALDVDYRACFAALQTARRHSLIQTSCSSSPAAAAAISLAQIGSVVALSTANLRRRLRRCRRCQTTCNGRTCVRPRLFCVAFFHHPHLHRQPLSNSSSSSSLLTKEHAQVTSATRKKIILHRYTQTTDCNRWKYLSGLRCPNACHAMSVNLHAAIFNFVFHCQLAYVCSTTLN